MPTTPTELELPVETGLSARVLTSGAPGLFVLVDEPRYVARIDPVDLDPEPVNYGLYDDRVRDDLKQTDESETGWIPYEIPDDYSSR